MSSVLWEIKLISLIFLHFSDAFLSFSIVAFHFILIWRSEHAPLHKSRSLIASCIWRAIYFYSRRSYNNAVVWPRRGDKSFSSFRLIWFTAPFSLSVAPIRLAWRVSRPLMRLNQINSSQINEDMQWESPDESEINSLRRFIRMPADLWRWRRRDSEKFGINLLFLRGAREWARRWAHVIRFISHTITFISFCLNSLINSEGAENDSGWRFFISRIPSDFHTRTSSWLIWWKW